MNYKDIYVDINTDQAAVNASAVAARGVDVTHRKGLLSKYRKLMSTYVDK
jgi:hypothetical protein